MRSKETQRLLRECVIALVAARDRDEAFGGEAYASQFHDDLLTELCQETGQDWQRPGRLHAVGPRVTSSELGS